MSKTETQKLVKKLGPGNYRQIARTTGLTPQHVSRVLRGIRGCSLRVAAKIAMAADVDLAELYHFIQFYGVSRKIKRKAKEKTAA